MRKSSAFLIFLGLGGWVVRGGQVGPAELPTAAQVVARYVEAVGGQAALTRVTSRGAGGSISVPTFGSFGAYEEIAQAPNRFLRTFRVPGYGVIQRCFDGENAWAEDPEYGVEDLLGDRLAEMRRAAEFHLGLALTSRYSTLTVRRRVTVNDREAYEVLGSLPQGNAETLWFDAGTGLLVAIESIETARNGTSRPVRMYYEDYKNVDGVEEPQVIRYESPEYIWIIRRQVVHNIPVDPAKFRKP